jgi:hypothetical protein
MVCARKTMAGFRSRTNSDNAPRCCVNRLPKILGDALWPRPVNGVGFQRQPDVGPKLALGAKAMCRLDQSHQQRCADRADLRESGAAMAPRRTVQPSLSEPLNCSDTLQRGNSRPADLGIPSFLLWQNRTRRELSTLAERTLHVNLQRLTPSQGRE